MLLSPKSLWDTKPALTFAPITMLSDNISLTHLSVAMSYGNKWLKANWLSRFSTMQVSMHMRRFVFFYHFEGLPLTEEILTLRLGFSHITQKNDYNRVGIIVEATWHCYSVFGKLALQKGRSDGHDTWAMLQKYKMTVSEGGQEMEKDSVKPFSCFFHGIFLMVA